MVNLIAMVVGKEEGNGKKISCDVRPVELWNGASGHFGAAVKFSVLLVDGVRVWHYFHGRN